MVAARGRRATACHGAYVRDLAAIGVGCGLRVSGAVAMKTILVASSKGGVGKTTVATHLAAQSALAGQRTVLVDVDPQASSTRWAERRAGLESAVLGPAG